VGRHVVRGLAPVLDLAVLESTELLVSELVTNSLRHAGSPQPIELQLSVTAGGGVKGEVFDMGDGFPGPPKSVRFPGQQATSGWGLYLVENIAHRWGVREDGGTTVWFEIDPPRHIDLRRRELAFGRSSAG
jgi:anti-sigma regulatory factor (Ser/Thr protein kinase)